MISLAQELLSDPQIKQDVLETLRNKNKELERAKQNYEALHEFELQKFTDLDCSSPYSLSQLVKLTDVQETIMRLERDIRHINFALMTYDGIYEEGEYEVLFEKAKQLSMKHVYELVTGEQVKRSNVRCVFHNEKTPSMKIYEDSFHCFGCGAHGDMIDFVQKKNNCSHREALEFLSKL